jgi:hypothetical protein
MDPESSRPPFYLRCQKTPLWSIHYQSAARQSFLRTAKHNTSLSIPSPKTMYPFFTLTESTPQDACMSTQIRLSLSFGLAQPLPIDF